MIDINLLRTSKGGNPELVRESQRKRFKSVELVDEVIALDEVHNEINYKAENASKDLNIVLREIAELKKKGEDASDAIKRSINIRRKCELFKESASVFRARRDEKLSQIANVVHESVFVSKNEDENPVIRTYGTPSSTQLVGSHHEILEKLGGYDRNRGLRIIGHRGYFLRNCGVRLNQALINYSLDFLAQRNYILLQPPFVMNKSVMEKTAQLEDFDEQLFSVNGFGENAYLIATSEQPISAYHLDEWFTKPKSELPKFYGGYSTCFRKEAGAHGKQTWGLFRIHQFEKVEQFVFCAPDESWEIFEKMCATSEEFLQTLGLSYRVISIVSGALNNAAAKKYDIEAWFPSYGEYKELVSCSNCTDYQSRSLGTHYGTKTGEKAQYVHCLNSTLCATERTLCCLLENYQKEDGVVVPEVLRPYMGCDFLPFETKEN